jgi:hypothetical protein
LKDHAEKTGELKHLGIILSKYDYDDEGICDEEIKIEENEDEDEISEDEYNDEIHNNSEETTLSNFEDRVKKMYEGTCKIIKFNAFGRILGKNHKASTALKKICKTSPDINTDFDLRWCLENYEEKQQLSYLNSLIGYHYKNYGTEQILCSKKSLISQITCPARGFCECLKFCDCVCHYHGNCEWESPKRLKDYCSGGNNCKYHGNERCIFGVLKVESKNLCYNYCHYHYNKKNFQISNMIKNFQR